MSLGSWLRSCSIWFSSRVTAASLFRKVVTPIAAVIARSSTSTESTSPPMATPLPVTPTFLAIFIPTMPRMIPMIESTSATGARMTVSTQISAETPKTRANAAAALVFADLVRCSTSSSRRTLGRMSLS